MAAQKQQTQINLLPRSDFDTTTTGRVVTWLLTTFRVGVIVTMLIVIAAFVARFGIDAKNSDLSDEIIQKQAVIASTQDFEEEFKKTQQQLATYKEIVGESMTAEDLQTFVSYIPAEIVLSDLSYKNNTLIVEGQAPSEQSVEQLLVNLTRSEKYLAVNLVSLDSTPGQENVLDFTLSAQKRP